MTKPASDPTWFFLSGSLAAFVPRISVDLPGTYLYVLDLCGIVVVIQNSIVINGLWMIHCMLIQDSFRIGGYWHRT